MLLTADSSAIIENKKREEIDQFVAKAKDELGKCMIHLKAVGAPKVDIGDGWKEHNDKMVADVVELKKLYSRNSSFPFKLSYVPRLAKLVYSAQATTAFGERAFTHTGRIDTP